MASTTTAARGPQEVRAMEHEDPAAPGLDTPEREAQRRYRAARRRVHELRGFYQHALIYLLVNGALAAWNLATDPEHLWFLYPLGGWGVGLTIHAITTFGAGSLFGADWERRKIEQILAAEEKRGRG